MSNKTNAEEISTSRILLGQAIFKMVVSMGDKNPEYVMSIIKPSIAHVEAHCAKSLHEVLNSNGQDEIQETYDTVRNNLAALPLGDELGKIIELEHFKLMLRYMVYCQRELGESNEEQAKL